MRRVAQPPPVALLCIALLAAHASAALYCGSSFADAAKCEVACPDSVDAPCPGLEQCFDHVVCASRPIGSATPGPPADSASNYCGASPADAAACLNACPDGVDAPCPSGQKCYAHVSCPAPTPVAAPSTTPASVAGTPEPSADSGGAATGKNVCGKDYDDAERRCARGCARGVDADCGVGERCYLTKFCAEGGGSDGGNDNSNNNNNNNTGEEEGSGNNTDEQKSDDGGGSKLSTMEIVGVVSGVIAALIAVEEAVRRWCKPRRPIEELSQSDRLGYS